MQGLSLDIPKRFFYLGTLMNKLGMESSKAEDLIGKSRAVWGELWLRIITENNTELQKSGKKSLSYKQKKRILVSAWVVGLSVLLLIGGL